MKQGRKTSTGENSHNRHLHHLELNSTLKHRSTNWKYLKVQWKSGKQQVSVSERRWLKRGLTRIPNNSLRMHWWRRWRTRCSYVCSRNCSLRREGLMRVGTWAAIPAAIPAAIRSAASHRNPRAQGQLSRQTMPQTIHHSMFQLPYFCKMVDRS